MDTVKSSKESKKTLLAMLFTKGKLFLAFHLKRCTNGDIRSVFDHMEERMGTTKFADTFKYILTDRGVEFRYPEALEKGN